MLKKIMMSLLIIVTVEAKDIVVDDDIGLMWQDEANIAETDWRGAKNYCNNLSLGGYDDWYLPSIDELMSIVNKNRYKPAIKKIFDNTYNTYYWSSTELSRNQFKAWVVYFNSGHDFYDVKSVKHDVRCVRSGE